MKRFSVAFVAITGCIVGPACQAIVGIGDRIEATDGANAGDGSTPSPEAGGGGPTDAADVYVEPPKNCPAGCIPAATAGWSGPSAIYDGAEIGKPTDCPPGYAKKEFAAHNGNITAPPATCNCGDPGIKDSFCSASVVTWDQPGCPGLGAKQGTATTAACFAFPDMGQSYQVMPGVLTPGTCVYPGAVFTTTEEQYETAQIACGLPERSVCAGNDQCITASPPTSPFGRLCIYKDGDEATCPSEDYKVRILAFKNVDDQRTCTACTGTPSGGSCGSNFGTRSSTLQCVAVPPTNKTVSTCYAHPGMGIAVDVGAMGPTGATCTLTGGKPTGEVKLIDPVTFCCNL